MIDVMQDGIHLAEEKADEMRNVLQNHNKGETIFCLLSYVVTEIITFPEEQRQYALDDTHYFLDALVEKYL